MSLDVAAQGEQEGLEPCPDPQRSFLTYRLPLEAGGKRTALLLFAATYKLHTIAPTVRRCHRLCLKCEEFRADQSNTLHPALESICTQRDVSFWGL